MFRKILILVSIVVILGLAYKLGSFVFKNEVVVENIDNTAPVSETIASDESTEGTPEEESTSVTSAESTTPKTSAPTKSSPPPTTSNDLSDIEADLNSFNFDDLDSGL